MYLIVTKPQICSKRYFKNQLTYLYVLLKDLQGKFQREIWILGSSLKTSLKDAINEEGLSFFKTSYFTVGEHVKKLFKLQDL